MFINSALRVPRPCPVWTFGIEASELKPNHDEQHGAVSIFTIHGWRWESRHLQTVIHPESCSSGDLRLMRYLGLCDEVLFILQLDAGKIFRAANQHFNFHRSFCWLHWEYCDCDQHKHQSSNFFPFSSTFSLFWCKKYLTKISEPDHLMRLKLKNVVSLK